MTNVLTWPAATLPLTDTVEILLPYSIDHGEPEQILEIVPQLEGAMRAVDPSIRGVSAFVVRDVALRDFLGRTIAVYHLALRLAVQLSCDVLPTELTRRQAQLMRGLQSMRSVS